MVKISQIYMRPKFSQKKKKKIPIFFKKNFFPKFLKFIFSTENLDQNFFVKLWKQKLSRGLHMARLL